METETRSRYRINAAHEKDAIELTQELARDEFKDFAARVVKVKVESIKQIK